jgi:mercuric reductase
MSIQDESYDISRGRNGKSSRSETYDLVVVGGGSAAFAAALKVSGLGGRASIVNAGPSAGGLPIGGTCVNVGCIPSKTMIRAGEAVHRARSTLFDGVRVSGEVSDFRAVTSQTQDLVDELRRSKYVDVVADDPRVEMVEGRARLASTTAVEVDGRLLHTKNILIATGAHTFVPDIPGLRDVDYLTNEDLYQLEERPEHLLVLGGGYVALENAQAFARLGSRVTILQRASRILPTEAADLTDALTAYLRAEGIDVRTGVMTKSVRRESGAIIIDALIDGEPEIVRGSHLLLATGRQANTQGLNLSGLQIETDRRGFVKVDDSLRTAAPNVFGAGDVLGEHMFVYTAAYEGNLAAQNAFQNHHLKRDYSALPWVIFTDPQVAGVGLDERASAEAGIDFEVTKLPLDQVPRSLAARDTRGFIKLIRDRETDRLVGTRILAPEGAELLMEATLAIKHGITIRELTETFHPYLMLSEGIKIAAITFSKDAKKLSCCAV